MYLLNAAVLLRLCLLLGRLLVVLCRLLCLLLARLLLVCSCLLARLCQLLAARLLLALEYALEVGNLIVTGHNLKNQAQLVILQNLHVVLGRLGVLRQNIGHFFVAHAKVLCDFVDAVFIF